MLILPPAMFTFILCLLNTANFLGTSYAKDVSYMESNIGHFSSGKLYIDLIAGVTQESVSRTMTEFIGTLDTTPQVFYYKYQDDGYVYVDEETADNELGFSMVDDLPNYDCTSNNTNVTTAAAAGYRYGARMAYGYPDVDVSLLPPPIEMNTSGSIVTYNMVMSEFDLVAIQADPATFAVCVTRLSQTEYIKDNPDSMPYYFQWKVNLDLNPDNFDPDLLDDLPPETVDYITNTGLSMFSIDQLFLDLNSALLVYGAINIPGLSPDSQLYFMLNQFLTAFVKTVDPDGNGVILGYSINEDDYTDYKTIFVPYKMNFQVSLHLDSDGLPDSKNNLNTLNYWVSANKRELAAPQVLPWNWIEEDDLNGGFDGVMSISREIMSEKLNTELRNELAAKMCYSVDCSMIYCKRGYDECGGYPLYWCYNFHRDLNSCPSADYTFEDGVNGLALSFHKEDDDSSTCDTYYPDFWARFSMRYEAWSKIYFEGSQIRFENEIMVDVSNSCEYGSAGTNGTAAHFLSTTIYSVQISDDHGQIEVNLDSSTQEDKSEELKFDPGQCTEDSAKKVQEGILNQMDDLKDVFNSYSNSLEKIFNGQQYFVFPGGNTFSFEDVTFSHYGDLMAHIKYRPVS